MAKKIRIVDVEEGQDEQEAERAQQATADAPLATATPAERLDYVNEYQSEEPSDEPAGQPFYMTDEEYAENPLYANGKKAEPKPGDIEEKSEALKQLESESELVTVPLDKVVVGQQPRKEFDDQKVRELADSIKAVGLINPPLLQRVEDEYRLVVGGRRIRAMKLLGLETIRAFVTTRALDAAAVLDVQMAENIHRDDLKALETAQALAQMMAPADEGGVGRTIDQLVDSVGKSKAWIYGVLKLNELCPEAKLALQRGELTRSLAEALARINGHGQQAKCLQELQDMRQWVAGDKPDQRDPVSYRMGISKIREYMLDLREAPFDTKADLLTEAGPCTTCPYNSQNQPGDLFGRSTQPQCLKVECYQEKCAASWAAEKQKQEARGRKVLTLAQGKALYKSGALKHDSQYVELNQPCSLDEKRRTWKKLVGEHCPQVVVAPDAGGKAHELADREEVLEALKKSGHKFAKDAADTPSVPRTAEEAAAAKEKEKTEALVRKQLADVFRDATFERVSKKGLALVDLRVIAEELMTGAGQAIAERRKVKGGFQGLLKALKIMNEHQVSAMIMECILELQDGPSMEEAPALAKLASLDLKAAEKKVREAVALASEVESGDKKARDEGSEKADSKKKGDGKAAKKKATKK